MPNIKKLISLMNKLISYILLFNICVSFGQTTKKIEIDKAKLDSLFINLDKHKLGMGSLAISKHNQLVYQKAFGYSLLNQSEKKISTTETFYRIGSVTKTFTAVLVFQFIEKGQLSLDDHLNKFFSEVPNSELITVRNLLNHSSGLANYSDKTDFQQWKYEKKSKKDLLAIIEKYKPQFKPGKKHQYSNTNFFLLSLILEKISGESYQKLLQKNIFQKINLKNTYYEEAKDSIRKKSKSYKYTGGNWNQEREDIAENHLGAGVIVSNTSDLLKFIDTLFSYQLIEKKSLNLMTSFDKDYGLGIFKFQFDSSLAYGQEGRINEYYTTLIHFPDVGLSIAYCTNGILYPRDDIISAVVAICLENNYKLPHFNGVKINDKKLTGLLGTYASNTMPIQVTCKADNNQLIVETQGKEFETIKINNNYFANYKYGYFFEFQSEKNTLLIKETDNIYILKKK